MDTFSNVSTIFDCQDIIGVELEVQLESNGVVTAKAKRNNTKTMDMLHKQGIPVAAVYSPYNYSGKKLKKEVAETEPFLLTTGTFTWLQIYDSVRLPLARGFCSDTDWNTYTMAAGETGTAAKEATRTEITKAIQDRITSLRNGVERRIETDRVTKAHEEAQALEAAAALAEGRAEITLPRSDFEKKNGANDNKSARDAAADNAVNSIRRLNKEEEPDYDSIGAIAAFRAALVCLNKPDPTLDPDDDANK